jgi:hypothetical protein
VNVVEADDCAPMAETVWGPTDRLGIVTVAEKFPIVSPVASDTGYEPMEM